MLKENCTESKHGRVITRYEGDDEKEALHQVMEQDKARERYKERLGIVGPVFSFLRGKQGLMKFRRRGLQGVRREFALHILAYNMNWAIALMRLYWFVFWSVLPIYSALNLKKGQAEKRGMHTSDRVALPG